MFSKSALFLSVFAVAAQLAVATPPACLLAAVNTQQQPWNLAAVCGDNSKQVGNQIKNLCGGSAQAAMSAFQQTCKNAGHAVVANPSSSSDSTSSGTATSSRAAHTASGLPSYTVSGSSSFISVPTGSSGAASPTGGLLPVGNGGSASNGTSYTPIAPTPVTQPSLGSGSGSGSGVNAGAGSASSSPSVPLSTGAASHLESPGLAGFVLAAAGLIFLV